MVPSILILWSTRLDWLMNRIADGEFTVESDRSVVVALGEVAVQKLRLQDERRILSGCK